MRGAFEPPTSHVQGDACAPSRGLRRQVLALRRRIDACRDCATLAPWRKLPVDSIGSLTTGCVLVGEAPGYVSWRNGRAFSNPSNFIFHDAMADLQDPRYKRLEDLVYITNVVCCQPAVGTTHANRSPTPAEARLCSRHLRDEIDLIRPRVCLAVGKLAAEALLGRPVHVTREHGRRHRGPHDSQVIVLMHPSARNGRHLKNLGLTPQSYRRQIRDIFAELIENLNNANR